jgi:hypothetical protein
MVVQRDRCEAKRSSTQGTIGRVERNLTWTSGEYRLRRVMCALLRKVSLSRLASKAVDERADRQLIVITC